MKTHWFAGAKWEFNLRVLMIMVVFVAAYSCYSFDHVPAGVVAGRLLYGWLGPRFPGMSLQGWTRTVFLFGAFLTFLAAIMRTWGTSYLKSTVMRDFRLHSERLVADGPYRYVRNPLYFGNILMAVGMGLTASRIGFFVFVIGMTLLLLRLILREEAELRETQGESYRAYCAAVPRLIPALHPRVPAAGGKPNWVDGFLGELMLWGFTAGAVVLALTFNGRLFQAILIGSFIVQWMIFAVQRRVETSKS